MIAEVGQVSWAIENGQVELRILSDGLVKKRQKMEKKHQYFSFAEVFWPCRADKF